MDAVNDRTYGLLGVDSCARRCLVDEPSGSRVGEEVEVAAELMARSMMATSRAVMELPIVDNTTS